MRTDVLQLYLRSSWASVGSQIVRKISAFASLWLLNRILSKAGYGDYAFAFTVVGLVVIVASGGLENAVMYRISRMELNRERERREAREFAGAALGWSLVVAGVVTAALIFGRPLVSGWANEPAAGRWIGMLSLLVPVGVARGMYRAWFEARKQIPRSLLFAEILPAAARVLFLAMAWVAWPTVPGVAAAVVLAEAIPLLGWILRHPIVPFAGGRLTPWDVSYSAKLMLTKGLNRLMWQLDVVLLGILSTSVQTAEYAVASSLALLLMIAHRMTNQVLRPRLGELLGAGDREAVQREYRQVRAVVLLATLLGAGVLALLGRHLLGIFGDYGPAMPVLLALVVGYLGTVSFGMNGGYLNIAGYAGWTLTTTVLMLGVNVLLNVILIPRYGAMGAAAATAASLTGVNVLTSLIVFRLDGLRTYEIPVFVTTGAAVGVVLLQAAGSLDPGVAVTLVLLVAVAYAVAERRLLGTLTSGVVSLAGQSRSESEGA